MIEGKIKKIIAETLNVGLNEVVLEASFEIDLGADSLDLVELIMSMEAEFGIEIADEEAFEMLTVQDMIDCIKRMGDSK